MSVDSSAAVRAQEPTQKLALTEFKNANGVISSIKYLVRTRTFKIILIAAVVLIIAIASGPYVMAALPIIGPGLFFILPVALGITELGSIFVIAFGATSLIGAKLGKDPIKFSPWANAAQYAIVLFKRAAKTFSEIDAVKILKFKETLQNLRREYNTVCTLIDSHHTNLYETLIANISGTDDRDLVRRALKILLQEEFTRSLEQSADIVLSIITLLVKLCSEGNFNRNFPLFSEISHIMVSFDDDRLVDPDCTPAWIAPMHDAFDDVRKGVLLLTGKLAVDDLKEDIKPYCSGYIGLLILLFEKKTYA
jgi:hypothetical protein